MAFEYSRLDEAELRDLIRHLVRGGAISLALEETETIGGPTRASEQKPLSRRFSCACGRHPY